MNAAGRMSAKTEHVTFLLTGSGEQCSRQVSTSSGQPCCGTKVLCLCQNVLRDCSSRYFPSMFAALRMEDQRAISAFTKLLNFAGVRSPLLGSDPPRSASRVWTLGSSSA
jgi:hypothetical protein